MEQKPKPNQRRVDHGPWPSEGYVDVPKLRAALGDAAEQTVRNYIARGLLPPLVRFGPNRVGLPVSVARQALADLPMKMAKQRPVRRGVGAREAAKVPQ